MATDGTFINPVGFCFTLFMGLLLVLLPRRFALVPVIMLACYMTMGQRIVIATLDFTMLRILVVFGWFRLIVRQEIKSVRLNTIDKVILLWILSSIIIYTLLWQTPDAFINRLGFGYDAVGMYFLFRFLLRDLDETKRVAKMFALLLAPVAMLMLIENATGRNAFAIFGGVPEMTAVRGGLLRCQGPFGHPILAGVFGATTLPLFVGVWWQGKRNRFAGAVGFVASTIIMVTSMSSTPVMVYLAGILGLAMWPLRNQMRAVRWGLVLMIIALDLVMKAPVWFLIARVKVFSGSTGYHRAFLIDRAIANLNQWWLLGTRSNEEWGFQLFDVTNHYVRVGVNGGLLTLSLFIAIIVLCFGAVGQAMKSLKRESRRDQLFLWAMGAALFAHVVAFFGVSYWDQIIVIWYLLLAMISRAGQLALLHPAHHGDSARVGWAAQPAFARDRLF